MHSQVVIFTRHRLRAAKTRSLQHGRRTWARCSPPPAPTYLRRCRTWCTRTEPSPPCDSTCSAWRTSAHWPRKEARGGSGAYAPGESFSHAVCVSLARIQKLPRLLVASSDGYLYIYNVDPQDGGECVLAQKHRCVWVFALAECQLPIRGMKNITGRRF